MGGFDEHAGMNGDWTPLPSPSLQSFFSAMAGDDGGSTKSLSEPSKDDNPTSGFTFSGQDRRFGSENGDQTTQPGTFGEQKPSSRSGLVERMAARAGYNAPRLNTDIVRPSAEISRNLDSRSPYLTIPPGLSPTSLLDSPVFLSNSLVQPSPTTGRFPFAPNGNENSKSSMILPDSSNENKDNFFEDFNSSSFAFKPVPESASISHGHASQPFMSWQSFQSIEASGQSESRYQPQSIETARIHSQNGPSRHLHTDFRIASTEKTDVKNIESQIRPFGAANENMDQSRLLEEHHDEDVDQIISGENANLNCGPSEDGYNWRKYGQKQVKGSEYPRSYYKCTYPNCPVKKKVERSHEGHITEIIYKGAHSHPKPPPSRRSGMGSSGALCDIQVEQCDGDRDGNLEVTSSTMALHGQNVTQFASSDAVDDSSTFSNEEEDDDRATHGSVSLSQSLGYDGEGDESESKRRKVEAYAADVSGATRAIREPRVVVQTTSEVDILDDGYRWRKYGQKVVKGNPNPRSYYKCTSTGCTVRKHVERASHDLKSVITTYEGKHNHDVPAARNSSHGNNNMGSQVQSTQSQIHRPEPSQIQNMARFERAQYGFPGRQQPGPSGYGYAMNLQGTGLSQMGMAGFGHNQGTMAVHGVNQYLGATRQVNQMGMMLPKGEPKVEPVSDPGLNIENASSVYHQMMNRLPLGHQM